MGIVVQSIPLPQSVLFMNSRKYDANKVTGMLESVLTDQVVDLRISDMLKNHQILLFFVFYNLILSQVFGFLYNLKSKIISSKSNN